MASASVTLFEDRPTLADARFGTDPMSAIWYLVARSELHRKWAVSEIARLFWPPVELGQYKLYWNQHGKPVGYASWASMPLAAIEQLVADTLRLEHQHWTGHGFWPVQHTLHTAILDMIALDNFCPLIVHDLRCMFRGQTVFARRSNHGRRRLAVFKGYPDVAIHAVP